MSRDPDTTSPDGDKCATSRDPQGGQEQASPALEPGAFRLPTITEAHSGADTMLMTGPMPEGMAVEPRLTPGMRLGGRYELRALLGQGGMGAVFLARDEILGTDVALKFVLELGTGGLRRLRAEVLLAQQVTHRNVCRTYDLEELEGFFFVKMEYIAGETLGQRLHRVGPLPIADALIIARAVAMGLEAAHAQGVVHCDLKPENILIEHGTERVVLMDFGVARFAMGGGRLIGDSQSGTPAYMAPEQILGAGVDARSDLYAFGCVLYQMLVGEVPHPKVISFASAQQHLEEPPPDPRLRRPELPNWLAAIVRRLLAKAPRDRYPSATVVLEALAGPRRRSWRRALVLGAVAVLGAMIPVGLGYRSRERRGTAWEPRIETRQPAYQERADAPIISPDGRYLAYIANREGFWRVYVEPLAGGEPRALTPRGGYLDFLRWAHDSQALLGVTRDFRVQSVPIHGGEPQVLASNTTQVDDCAGRLVRLQTGAPGCPFCLVLLVRDGLQPSASEHERFRFPPGTWIDGLRCDPKGERLVYPATFATLSGALSGKGDLYLLDLARGSPRRLTSDEHQNLRPVFTPDGRSIVFSSLRSSSQELWELPLTGGSPMPITTMAGHATNPTISPDGKLLIYDQTFESDTLQAYHVDTNTKQLISTTLDLVLQPHPTPDGRAVVVQLVRQGRGHAAIWPLAEGAPRLLVPADVVGLTLDGRALLYAIYQGTETEILTLPLTGGLPRSITRVPGHVRTLVPDDHGLVHAWVRDGDGRGAWSAPFSGGAAVHETTPGVLAVMPAPAGGWRLVGFDAPDKRRWLRWHVVAPGWRPDDPRARVIEAIEHVAWAADGQSFLTWNGSEIRRHFVATGKDEPFYWNDQMEGGMALSHDGKTLFLAEFGGYTTRQMITNFAERPRPAK
ncbi:MAG TPA: protein kinase [Polyangia bacterium]|nr:protein kinase [Polyangia bacterium]